MPRGVFTLARMCERSLGAKFSKVSDKVYFLYEVTVYRTFQNLRSTQKSVPWYIYYQTSLCKRLLRKRCLGLPDKKNYICNF